jgi:aspartate/methionine/tyrosine aminotransferase
METEYRFSKRVSHFIPPRQWDSMRMAREVEGALGPRVIHFEKGDYAASDFGIPDHVHEALTRGLREGHGRYDPGPGILELREAIAEEMCKRGRVTSPEEVVVTTGAKQALFMVILAFLDDGDGVMFPNPGYPPDEVWATFTRAAINHAPLTTASWQFDTEKLARDLAADTKLLIINSPQRPNGELVENLEGIADICLRQKQLIVVSDEIFSHLIYDGHRHRTISALPGMAERSVVIDSFSKTYAMTGWRIGWAVAPKPVAEKLSIFLQDSITNVPVFIQKAAHAALVGPQDWVETRTRNLQHKRDLIVAGLNAVAGVECQSPPSTFYAFPKIKGLGLSSQEVANKLLHEAAVAVVPGTAFGDRGEGYIRITYAVPDEDIKEGLHRIENVLGSR